MWRCIINEMILRFYRVKISKCRFFKLEFLNYIPCSDNVVSFSVKLNWALKALLDISFISDKIMSRYSIESIKRRARKKYLIPFSK